METNDIPNPNQDSSSERRVNKNEPASDFQSLDPLKGLIVAAYKDDARIFGPAHFSFKNEIVFFDLLTTNHKFSIDGLATRAEYQFLKAALKNHQSRGGKILLVKEHPSAKTEFIHNDRMIEVRLRHLLEYANRTVFLQQRGKEIWVFESEEVLANYPFPFTPDFRKSIRKKIRFESKSLSESKILRNLSLDLKWTDKTDRFVFLEILRIRIQSFVNQVRCVFVKMFNRDKI